ncbi:relaxase/mobilization nuclease domain-containing protein [Escherichia coli]|nr:relaxase/mobilization nuclease domain-containing protein [Escherichia coli]
MIVGFSSYGTGNGKSAADYLKDKERENRKDNPPTEIKGDLNATTELINSLDFKHKYTSGVLSFAPGEKVTPEMENHIIDRFEKVAFAGMTKDRYSIAWVRHEHAGHHELHFITARVDLQTGKSYNIKPPGQEHQKIYDDFRSEINCKYGLADPDDPARKRDLVLTDKESKINFAGSKAEVKEAINDILTARTVAGTIKDRNDVINALKEIGFDINRTGRDYITVISPDTGEKYRLKGTLYEKEFNITRTIEGTSQTREGVDRERSERPERRYSDPDPRSEQFYKARVDEHINRRAEYNQKRYGENIQAAYEITNREMGIPPLISINNSRSNLDLRHNLVHDKQNRENDRVTNANNNIGTTEKEIRVSGEYEKNNTVPESSDAKNRILPSDRGYSRQSEAIAENKDEKKSRINLSFRSGEINNDRTGAQPIEHYEKSFREIDRKSEIAITRIRELSSGTERVRERSRTITTDENKPGEGNKNVSSRVNELSDSTRQLTEAINLMIARNLASQINEKRLSLEREKLKMQKIELEKALKKLAEEFVKNLKVSEQAAKDAVRSFARDIKDINQLEKELKDPEMYNAMVETVKDFDKSIKQEMERERQSYSRSR